VPTTLADGRGGAPALFCIWSLDRERWGDAEKLYREALDLGRDPVSALLGLADLELRRGNRAEALIALAQALNGPTRAALRFRYWMRARPPGGGGATAGVSARRRRHTCALPSCERTPGTGPFSRRGSTRGAPPSRPSDRGDAERLRRTNESLFRNDLPFT